MGFPIRKSADQRLFAPPHSLSQRITSFIACACQGIHQLPLRHLIVLIANAHQSSNQRHQHKKTSFSRSVRELRLNRPIIWQGLSVPTDKPSSSSHEPSGNAWLQTLLFHAQTMESEQIFSLRCHTEQAESESSPQTCFLQMIASATLSTPVYGGAGRDRTDDILLAKQALSQLSYGP